MPVVDVCFSDTFVDLALYVSNSCENVISACGHVLFRLPPALFTSYPLIHSSNCIVLTQHHPVVQLAGAQRPQCFLWCGPNDLALNSSCGRKRWLSLCSFIYWSSGKPVWFMCVCMGCPSCDGWFGCGSWVLNQVTHSWNPTTFSLTCFCLLLFSDTSFDMLSELPSTNSLQWTAWY